MSTQANDAPGASGDLIACPHCDALYRVTTVAKGERVNCARCHAPLIHPRAHAGLFIIALATAAMVLIVAALFLPFLEIRRMGFSNGASLIDAALAFSGGPMVVLSLAVVAMIVALPLTRLMLTVYALTPLVLERRAWPGARRAFLLSERLKPWSMAEIFMVGCVVSLFKLTDLARVEFGAAFWMFIAFVALVSVQDRLMCRWSVWRALER
ncbi:paraquat-inducible protein A [Pseudaestuariivita sp.]|uniref:paraquat-inducible protein A n=1 Tax=Pseudaestuariivita sp. TaxID=2211669 RepID=UPI004059F1F7